MTETPSKPAVPASGASAPESPAYDYNRVIPPQQDGSVIVERKNNVVILRNLAQGSISVSVDENRDGRLDGPEDSHLDVIGGKLMRVARGACSYSGEIKASDFSFETLDIEKLGQLTTQLANGCPAIKKLQGEEKTARS